LPILARFLDTTVYIQRQPFVLDNSDVKPQIQTNIEQQYRPRNSLFRRQRQRTFGHKSTKPLKALMGFGSWRNELVRGATYPLLFPNTLALLLLMD
jgi:hypothetical protein